MKRVNIKDRWYESISLRLPVALLERIKIVANKRDVPYQSLIKMWLFEKIDAA